MKNKNIAAVLALTFGVFGVHRFYLRQTGLGILYIFLMFIFGFSAILGLIDALIFLTMDKEDFDFKYNRKHLEVRRRYPHDSGFDKRDAQYRRGYREEEGRSAQAPTSKKDTDQRAHQRQETTARRQTTQNAGPAAANPYRQEGVERFKEYDYIGAIASFEKALEIDPQDIAVHFNLACTYSLTENKKETLYHLDRAVAYGFKDFQRIREHDALAWIRVQEEYRALAANNFRLSENKKDAATTASEIDLLNSHPDLLEQLRKLSELRNRGFLTETEFAAQKRKLMS